jgi:hypothetical protein
VPILLGLAILDSGAADATQAYQVGGLPPTPHDHPISGHARNP